MARFRVWSLIKPLCVRSSVCSSCLSKTHFYSLAMISQKRCFTVAANGPSSAPRAGVSVLVQMTTETRGDQCAYTAESSKYLLVLRANDPGSNKWSLPGGKLLFQEPLLAGALRELQEETGISYTDIVTPLSHKAFASDIITPEYHYVIATVMVQVKPKAAEHTQARDDAKRVQWFTLEELKALQRSENITGNIFELLQWFSGNNAS